jgi:E3 ubiquitin-protein ligase SHPRH
MLKHYIFKRTGFDTECSRYLPSIPVVLSNFRFQKEYQKSIDGYHKELIFTESRINSMIARISELQNNLRVAQNGMQPSTEPNLQSDKVKSINSEHHESIQTEKARLRLWKELKHKLLFLLASAYHNQGSAEHAKEDSEIIKNETLYYDKAEELRKDLLNEYEQFVNISRSLLAKLLNKNSQLESEVMINFLNFEGGLIISGLMDRMENVVELLNKQWDILSGFREQLQKILTMPISPINEEENSATNPTGQEFEEGVVLQEKAMIYQNLFYDLLTERKTALNNSGQLHGTARVPINEDEKHWMKRITKMKLLDHKDSFKSILGSIRNLTEREDVPEMERILASHAFQHFNEILANQQNCIETLEKEVVMFRRVFNDRVQYFTHLNHLSDQVVSVDYQDNLDELMVQLNEKAKKLNLEIVREMGKKRYLEYLSKNDAENVRQSSCGVCLTQFDTGVLSECGHFFCMDCTKAWIQKMRKCPTCNLTIDIKNLTSVRLNHESVYCKSTSQVTPHLERMSKISINGSFGTKLDSIIRHILYIIQENPTEKILCFSQWSKLNEILSRGLEQNRIGYITLEGSNWDPTINGSKKLKDKSQSVTEFINNPSLNVIMLNMKSQSSGLTLTAATHVFLLDPVLNRGFEQQGAPCLTVAIGRVHRIGQFKKTFIWRYIVTGTVEETILERQVDVTNNLQYAEDTVDDEFLIQLFNKGHLVQESF